MGPENYCFEAKNDEEAMKRVRNGYEEVKLEEITKPKLANTSGRFFFDYKVKRIVYHNSL